jgi:hypothetical protein
MDSFSIAQLGGLCYITLGSSSSIPPNPERHTLPHQQCNVLLDTYHLPS